MKWAAPLTSPSTCGHCRHRLAQHAEVAEDRYQCAFCHCFERGWIRDADPEPRTVAAGADSGAEGL